MKDENKRENEIYSTETFREKEGLDQLNTKESYGDSGVGIYKMNEQKVNELTVFILQKRNKQTDGVIDSM